MSSPVRSKSAGWLASMVLAVLYVLVILASLLVVGVLITGSWQAAFLGIGWSTVVGFEIGLAATVAAGFAITSFFVSANNLIQRWLMGQPGAQARAGRPVSPSPKSWQVRLLVACLVLPPLALFGLRALAVVASLVVRPDATIIPGPSEQAAPVAMGTAINTAHREAEPSFTTDGRTMYFNCNRGDICVSHFIGTWEGGDWTPPERLGGPISTEYEEVEPVINAAGDKLYFTSIRPGGRLKDIPFLSLLVNVFRVVNILATAGLGRSFFGGLGLDDIYVSYWIDGAWSEPQYINDIAGEPPVNTKFADHCLFFTADGKEAFWTSTRPGGFGDNDIWTSRLVDGTWSEPENLGPTINGPGSEHTSIPTPDGQSLYVTAARAEGYGGDDIYVVTRGADGKWGRLANLGPPFNGPGDDRCPAWTPDFEIFLFDSIREGGFGARDIWWVYFNEVVGYPLAGTARSAKPDVVRQLSNQVSRR